MAKFESDSNTECLSREISDAARDLANRIDLGEFDDLDDGPMADLRFLSDMMEHWAAVTQALEERLSFARGTLSNLGIIRPTTIRN